MQSMFYFNKHFLSAYYRPDTELGPYVMFHKDFAVQ